MKYVAEMANCYHYFRVGFLSKDVEIQTTRRLKLTLSCEANTFSPFVRIGSPPPLISCFIQIFSSSRFCMILLLCKLVKTDILNNLQYESELVTKNV